MSLSQSPSEPRRRHLLTVEQFAAELNVSPKTVYEWVAARRYPFVRVGRMIRFRPEVLDGIIAAGEVPARTKTRTYGLRTTGTLGNSTAPVRSSSGNVRANGGAR